MFLITSEVIEAEEDKGQGVLPLGGVESIGSTEHPACVPRIRLGKGDSQETIEYVLGMQVPCSGRMIPEPRVTLPGPDRSTKQVAGRGREPGSPPPQSKCPGSVL